MGKITRIIYGLICITLFGCGNNKSLTMQPQAKQYALRELLDSCLQSQPNANNNDVARSILADTIKMKFQQFKGDSLPFIGGLPVQYEMCLEYKRHFESDIDDNAVKYVVKFSFGEIASKCELSDKYKTTFQVFTILGKDAVATLVDGSLYHIQGIFRDFANNSQETGFVLPSGKCIVDYPRVTSIDEQPYINLGTLVLDSVSFTKIPKL